MAIADNIGRVKRDNDVVILQSGRWASIVDRVLAQADKLQLSEDFLRTVLEAERCAEIWPPSTSA